MILVVSIVALVGCGGDGGRSGEPSSVAIEAAVADRHGADPDQAACVREYLVADYDADELAVLVDEGVGALPQTRWETYLTASLACLTRPLDER